MSPGLTPERLEQAQRAVEYAQRVRAVHRKRTEKTSDTRTQDIDIALDRLRSAMKPIRSFLGSFPYQSYDFATTAQRTAASEASQAIQKERRKLWKMKAR